MDSLLGPMPEATLALDAYRPGDASPRHRDPYHKRVLRTLYRAGLGLQSLLCLTTAGRGENPRVFFGGARSGNLGGPLVKVKRLKESFPERRWFYNLVYVLSNAPYLPKISLRLLRWRGIPIVHNQNGVFYPAWYAGDWESQNRRMAYSYHLADHVFYQSEFCRRSAERFLGARAGRGEVLYNAVDTRHFSPRPTEKRGARAGPFVFLLSGKIESHLFYRVECTVRGLASTLGQGLDCRLAIAGWVTEQDRRRTFVLADELGIGRAIEFLGEYTQESAPDIYRSADALVMTTHNNACPNTVIEAMACGLPVVYVRSGGVPEIVGDDAGAGVDTGDDWLEPRVPDAASIAAAMLRVAAMREQMSSAARARAVERFDLANWIACHQEVFCDLLANRRQGKASSSKATDLSPGPMHDAPLAIDAYSRGDFSPRHRDPYHKHALRTAYRTGLGLQSLLCLATARRGGNPRVFYGGARSGNLGGPLVKVKRLKDSFPEHRWSYNLVYVLSNAPYLPDASLRLLKSRGIPIVHNQNGVFYPGWYEGDWEGQNRRMACSYHLADHVFYQSEFCRDCAGRFLGERSGRGEVLYNAVDTRHFSPRPALEADHPNTPFRFLLSGKIDPHLFYRIESSIRGLAVARKDGLDCHLMVAGWVGDTERRRAQSLADKLGVSGTITFLGPYTQENAPEIYCRADAFVMTKHADPCPNTVIEAMSCGLPVVFVKSGGVPEIVGDDAGAGVDTGEDWFEIGLPDPASVAAAMLRVAESREQMSSAARARAIERFDLTDWIARHRQVFEKLLGEED